MHVQVAQFIVCTLYIFSTHVHMQVLSDDGYIHPPCPFPLHCSPLCIALSKGSVLIILVILRFVMSVLPVDSDQQKHAAHGIQATLFQDQCHYIRCSQSEQGAAALLKYIRTHTVTHLSLMYSWYIYRDN